MRRQSDGLRGGQALSDEELAILQHYVELEGQQVRITKKLDDALYARIKLVLERLGGVYLPVRKRFEFDVDPRALLAQTVASRQFPKENPLDFYYSPPGVVEAVLAEVEWSGTMHGFLRDYELEGRPIRVLEPSAGLGHLADAFRERYPMATIHVCEMDPYRRAVLESKGYTVVAGDFLAYRPEEAGYDVILMNPPFGVGGTPFTFIEHVRRAHGMLSDHPLSKLVSVVSAEFSKAARYRAFYIQVLQFGGFEALPQGAFTEAGTPCKTSLIWMDKRKNYFYATWDQPDRYDGYPNQRIKYAWMYVSIEQKLSEAYEQLKNDMVEGRLTVYRGEKAAPETKKAIRVFCQNVTDHLLYACGIYIPFSQRDEAFMEEHILADYRKARAQYREVKLAQWRLAQQRQRQRLLKQIEDAEGRIRRCYEQVERETRRLHQHAQALEALERASAQAPAFAPAAQPLEPGRQGKDPPFGGKTQPSPYRQYSLFD